MRGVFRVINLDCPVSYIQKQLDQASEDGYVAPLVWLVRSEADSTPGHERPSIAVLANPNAGPRISQLQPGSQLKQ